MKRYTVLLALVLMTGTTAWASGCYGGAPNSFTGPNPCWAPPSPCYTPPIPCPPTPCPPPIGHCYKPAPVSYGSVTSHQNATLYGTGMAFAVHAGGVVLWNKGFPGCGPRPTVYTNTNPF